MDKKLLKVSFILMGLGLAMITYSLALSTNIHFYPQKRVFFTMTFEGTPDAYGNQIRNVTLYQDTGGSWVDRGNLTYLTYSANSDIEGILNQTVRLDVYVYLNYTFSDSLLEAQVETKVYVGVTDEFTRDEADYTSISLLGDEYWVLLYRYEWDRPDTSKTYDVCIEYYVSDVSGLGNPQDLDEQDITEEHFYDPQFLAESIFNDLGITYQEALELTTPWGGSWGHPSDQTGYFETSGFKPFHGVSAFTIDLWLVCADNSSLYVFASQRVDTNHNFHIYWDGTSKFYLVVGDGSSNVYFSTEANFNEYQLYHLIGTWDKNNNSGKPVLYLNGSTAKVSGSGITNDMDCDIDLNIGRHTTGLYYFQGFFVHLNIYNRRMDYSESLEVHNGGIGYVYDSTGLNNSYSFDEYSSGYYPVYEDTLHDGLGVYTESEQWDIDFISQTVASYEFWWWGEYPNEYIWLASIVLLICAPCFTAWFLKNTDEDFELKILVIGVCFVIVVCSFALFTGMTPTP